MEVYEDDLRRLFRSGKRFPPGTVWLSEPGMGSDYGLPDVWVTIGTGFYPLELKRGVVPLQRFEPSQRKFHKLSLLRGCRTFCMSIIDKETALGYRIELARGELQAYIEEEFKLHELTEKYLQWASLAEWLEKSIARK